MFKPLILTVPLALLTLIGIAHTASAVPYRVYSTGSPGFTRGVVIPPSNNLGYDVYRYPQGGYYQQPGNNFTTITDNNVWMPCVRNRGYYQNYPYHYPRGNAYPPYNRGYARW
ncbi:hypothetical protein [Synechocystis sp. LKSZ1]|uniref:hypothetical protein n=1 Tax=Synechocystis sp. LKSZ1 TaxID=3144951 RepID=UPI00336BDEED